MIYDQKATTNRASEEVYSVGLSLPHKFTSILIAFTQHIPMQT